MFDLLLSASASLYSLVQPAPPYAQDGSLLTIMCTTFNVLGSIGNLAEKLGVAQAVVVQRSLLTKLTPTPKSSSCVTFDYRQFADSNTLVGTPADESRRSGAAVVFIHGGGWTFGSPELYWETAAELVDKLGVAFFGIRYRLAPEHPFPAAFDDSLAAVEAIFDEAESMGIDRSRIAIAGDSAGGQLTAAIVQHLRMRKSQHRPKAQVLVYPLTQFVNLRTQSMIENANAPMVDVSKVADLYSLVLFGNKSMGKAFRQQSHVTPKVQAAYLAAVGEEVPLTVDEETRRKFESPELESLLLDYRLCPLLNPDIDSLDLPPTLLIACKFDPIYDESVMYSRLLQRAGVKAQLKEYQTYHGSLSMPTDGKQIREDIIAFLTDFL